VVDQIPAAEVARLLKDPSANVLLLDVREDDERETAAIQPSVHIPMGQIAQRAGELPADRRIVVYCHMGGRSNMVAAFLANHGHPDVANLSGGIDAWSRTVDPDVPRY
jgi:sulfur-carrier protein adenylyltransferase/sulfurtransferase